MLDFMAAKAPRRVPGHNSAMNRVTLPQLEQAINYWRNIHPSQGEESRLCPQAAALAAPYALMIISRRHELGEDEFPTAARDAFSIWRRAMGL
jgi:hypothetical protein